MHRLRRASQANLQEIAQAVPRIKKAMPLIYQVQQTVHTLPSLSVKDISLHAMSLD